MADFGELLQHARAYKNVSLREAERATKINRHHLAALEREEFEELPPLIYARGIVRNYAQYLGLDPVATLALFEEVHGQRSGGFRVVPAVRPLDIPSHWAPNFAIIAFMVVMSAVIFAWIYSAYFAPKDAVPSPTIAAVASPSPSATETVAADATPTTPMPPVVGSPEPTATPTQNTTPAATATPVASPTPAVHLFEVSTTADVWVEITVDGTIQLSAVLGAGESRAFQGQTMHIVSGNALAVFVSVDGVDQGALGTVWDQQQTYPLGANP